MPTASNVGSNTFSGRARQLTASAPSNTPPPTIAPTNACVVDTGSRATVANVTHATVPINTARVNSGAGEGGHRLGHVVRAVRGREAQREHEDGGGHRALALFGDQQ